MATAQVAISPSAPAWCVNARTDCRCGHVRYNSALDVGNHRGCLTGIAAKRIGNRNRGCAKGRNQLKRAVARRERQPWLTANSHGQVCGWLPIGIAGDAADQGLGRVDLDQQVLA